MSSGSQPSADDVSDSTVVSNHDAIRLMAQGRIANYSRFQRFVLRPVVLTHRILTGIGLVTLFVLIYTMIAILCLFEPRQERRR